MQKWRRFKREDTLETEKQTRRRAGCSKDEEVPFGRNQDGSGSGIHPSEELFRDKSRWRRFEHVERRMLVKGC